MRVSIITSTFKPELSGIAETVHKRVRELSSQGGVTLQVIGPDYGPVSEVLPDYERWRGPLYPGVEVVTYPTYAYRTAVQKADTRRIGPFWTWSVDPLLEAFRPDLIHVDEPERLFGLQGTDGYGRRIGLKYAQKHGIPTVGMWHTDYIHYAQVYLRPWEARLKLPIALQLIRWVYNGYDLTLCNSQQALERIQGWGVTNARFLPSVGIDLENFSPRPRQRSDSGVELLYVGRVTPEKNIAVLLDAFLGLAERFPEVRLKVVGDGPSLVDLRHRYAHPRIHFTGKIENALLPGVFAEADVFINPSHTETFTQTALEAAACGLPIVVAAGGGNFETVQEGINGRYFAPGSVEGLIQALEPLLRSSDLRRQYAVASPTLAARFDNRLVAAGFLQTWRELIERRRA